MRSIIFTKTFIYIFILFAITSCNEKHQEEKPVMQTNTNMAYQNKLNETKNHYPFARWRESFKNGLTQYTEENCNKARKIFDDLISGLIAAGENAGEETKVKLFKTAILATNDLSAEDESLIETGEREDLCELTNKITVACGLDPKKYGSGEGLASEWREW